MQRHWDQNHLFTCQEKQPNTQPERKRKRKKQTGTDGKRGGSDEEKRKLEITKNSTKSRDGCTVWRLEGWHHQRMI